MMMSQTLADCSQPARYLIRLMQHVNFGRIADLSIHEGRPDFGRPYRCVRTMKLANSDCGHRPGALSADFTLRKEHLALIGQMASLADGTRLSIQVKHGLPFLIEVEQDHQGT